MSDPTSIPPVATTMADRAPGVRLTSDGPRRPSSASSARLRSGGRGEGGAIRPRSGSGAASGGAARLSAPGRKVRVPHLLLGSLLVIVCGTAFFLVSLQASDRTPVLALARDVNAGQVLRPEDLRVVRVAAGTDVSTLSSANASSVIGGVMAAPRSAGELLAPADVAASKFPPAGKAVAAVPLKSGQFPPGLSAGVKVAALVAPSEPAGTSAPAGAGSPTGANPSWLPGLVVSVDAGDADSGQTVVSLLMSQSDAATLGTAVVAGSGSSGGSVSLLVLSPGTPVDR